MRDFKDYIKVVKYMMVVTGKECTTTRQMVLNRQLRDILPVVMHKYKTN